MVGISVPPMPCMPRGAGECGRHVIAMQLLRDNLTLWTSDTGNDEDGGNAQEQDGTTLQEM